MGKSITPGSAGTRGQSAGLCLLLRKRAREYQVLQRPVLPADQEPLPRSLQSLLRRRQGVVGRDQRVADQNRCGGKVVIKWVIAAK